MPAFSLDAVVRAVAYIEDMGEGPPWEDPQKKNRHKRRKRAKA